MDNLLKYLPSVKTLIGLAAFCVIIVYGFQDVLIATMSTGDNGVFSLILFFLMFFLVIVLGIVGFQAISNKEIEKERKNIIRVKGSQNIEITGSQHVKIAQVMGNYIHYKGEKKIGRFLTMLPSPDDVVIGREKELSSIYNALEQSQKAVLLVGLGGIGKTTIAMTYANRYKDHYKHIAWVEQSGDFASDLITNPLLIQNLGFTPSNSPKADTESLLNQLANLEGKSLLILDNVNHQLNDFKDFLPKAPKWHVLITSREILPFAKMIPIDFISEVDALKLFYTHYTLDKDDNIAKAILQAIDYHTLTLEILAKTAQKQKIKSLKAILKMLKEQSLQTEKPIDINSSIHTIFEFDEEMNADELFLLKQFTALPPTFITWELLAELLQLSRKDKSRWNELNVALDSLREKGWLTYEDQQQAYMMHPIIQEVLKEKLKPTYEELQKLIDGVSAKLYTDQSKNNLIDIFPFLPFGERIIQVVSNQSSEDFTKFQNNLAGVYRTLGDYEQARDLLKSALASDIANFGEQHPNTAISRSNLALVYQALGDYEQARDLLKSALASDIANFGEQHPNTAASRSNLALVYQALGDYEQARDLLKSALASAIANFGEQHPNTAVRRSNLATVYQALGDYEQARNLFEQALQSDIKNFGEQHPNTAVRRSNLALVYQALGDYEQARDLLKSTLTSDIANFGEPHPNTAASRSNLALVYQALGDYEQARDLLKSTLTSDIANFGEQHPNSVVSRSNLALVYQALGDYEQARDLFEKAFHTFQSFLGENHPNTKTVKSWLNSLEKIT